MEKIKGDLTEFLMGITHAFHTMLYSFDEPLLGFLWMSRAGLAKGHFPSIKEVTECYVGRAGFPAFWIDFN